MRFAIYYGPWECSARLMARCEGRCADEGHILMGCIWLADFKGDWDGRWAGLPAQAGGRLAISHCCCNYPTTDAPARRRVWNNAREGFRERWTHEFGAWPETPGTGKAWAGHHIRDLFHGGHPTAPANILPVPSEVHSVYNLEYPACYAGAAKWRRIGPDRPYAD